MTLKQRNVTQKAAKRDIGGRDASRARGTSSRLCHGVTRDISARDVTERRDSDSPLAPLRAVTITLEPWPFYNETTGAGPVWRVRVCSPRFNGVVAYSKRMRRFTAGNETMRLRRGSPKVYAEALALVERSVLTHAERLATDPRFAGWLGLMAADDPDPAIAEAAQRRADEQLELTRRAKCSYLCWAQGNPEADPKQISEARQFLADHPPLRRALGTGEPA